MGDARGGETAAPAAEYDRVFRQIAAQHDGKEGVWAYQAFDYCNATFFDGRLPTPFISWGLTPHGHCLGLTGHATPPYIQLHPGLLAVHTQTFPDGREKTSNWSIPAAWLGPVYAFDVLLHECMHVAVMCLHGRGHDSASGGDGGSPRCPCGPSWKSGTSHNNPHWLAEVNRLAPLLGLPVVAARSKTRRVPIDGAEPGKRGKMPTRVVRATESTVSFDALSRFPSGVRVELGLTSCYTDKTLPFPHALE